MTHVHEATHPQEATSLAGHPFGDALAALDQGARLLEAAYRELWSARELERRDSALGESERIRDLCHEIRNPLGGVRGLGELLRRELEATPSTDRATRLLGEMLRGLDTLEQAVTRRRDSEDLHADAGSIAEETAGLALAESRASGHDVTIRVEAPDGVELPLPAREFRAILSNLVRNAVEACAPDGMVRLRVESDLDEVRLVVRDDGRGLPAVPDATLFRRGFSTKGTGRGRGLALLSDLVERRGGTIFFGRCERGTIARVRLPRR
jgi:two-component system, CitB family, sensor kinase